MQNVSLLAGCDMVVPGFEQIRAQLPYRASGCSIGLPVVVGTSRRGEGGRGEGGREGRGWGGGGTTLPDPIYIYIYIYIYIIYIYIYIYIFFFFWGGGRVVAICLSCESKPISVRFPYGLLLQVMNISKRREDMDYNTLQEHFEAVLACVFELQGLCPVLTERSPCSCEPAGGAANR